MDDIPTLQEQIARCKSNIRATIYFLYFFAFETGVAIALLFEGYYTISIFIVIAAAVGYHYGIETLKRLRRVLGILYSFEKFEVEPDGTDV